jgi:hypothetical protein
MRKAAVVSRIGGVALAGMTMVLLAGCDITTTPGPPKVVATGGIATAVPAPKPTPIAVTCPTGTATLKSSNGLYTLAKNCTVVTVTGSSLSITAGAIATLTIHGFFDTVTATSVGTVRIKGDSNTVKTQSVGKSTVDGTYNQVGPPG